MEEISLNLPAFDIRVRLAEGRREVFDPLRRRWVRLSPEEWVRQHFVHWLTHALGYPPGLIANEAELRVGGKSLRPDTVVYGRDLRALMVVEYKAPDVPLTEAVFRQATAYNTILRAPYIAVSNGMAHHCLAADAATGKYRWLTRMPEYGEISEAGR